MRSWNYTTGSLMLLIGLVAMELAFFQGVWSIILIPVVTMAVLTVNLGLVFILLRPHSLKLRILGMLLGGILAVFAAIGYYALYRPMPPGGGVVGKSVSDYLVNWASSLEDPSGNPALVLRSVAGHMIQIEFVLLDLVGIAIIWACGSLENWGRARWVRRRAVGLDESPPLSRDAISA